MTINIDLKDIVTLCKRRGFIFHASDIYGGINGLWDYGPLGIELKNNLKNAWWDAMVHCTPLGLDGQPIKIMGLDSAIIQHPKTWEASGHIDNFSDPLVDCRETKMRYRADNLILLQPKSDEGIIFCFLEGSPQVEIIKRIRKFVVNAEFEDYMSLSLIALPTELLSRVLAPDAKVVGTLTEPRNFNLMFKTEMGALVGQNNLVYLRPETAQGIFLNYKNILNTYNIKLPFGIAQIGKAFRNEITPRNFIFRSREFEQMELEWFCDPQEAQMWYEFWQEKRYQWWLDIGIRKENIRIRPHTDTELAHYARAGLGTVDIEYSFPFSSSGFGELEGVAHRGNYDLSCHQQLSKVNMEYFDQQNRQRFLPHVIEPAAGLNRGLLAVLLDSYTVDNNRPSGAYLRLAPKIAPIKAAILPLMNKVELNTIAQNIFLALRARYRVELDTKNSIGKRYAKHDEIGTLYCITIDHQSLVDHTVTIRDRNTTHQLRVAMDQLPNFLNEALA